MKILKLTLLGVVLWIVVIVLGELYLSFTDPLTMLKKVNVWFLQFGFPVFYLLFFVTRFLLRKFTKKKLSEEI